MGRWLVAGLVGLTLVAADKATKRLWPRVEPAHGLPLLPAWPWRHPGEGVVGAGVEIALLCDQHVMGSGQAADAVVGGQISPVVIADQGRHIGRIHIVWACGPVQGMGLVPAAHHMAAHRKQGLGILAGQGERHGMELGC